MHCLLHIVDFAFYGGFFLSEYFFSSYHMPLADDKKKKHPFCTPKKPSGL